MNLKQRKLNFCAYKFHKLLDIRTPKDEVAEKIAFRKFFINVSWIVNYLPGWNSETCFLTMSGCTRLNNYKLPVEIKYIEHIKYCNNYRIERKFNIIIEIGDVFSNIILVEENKETLLGRIENGELLYKLSENNDNCNRF